MNGIWSVEFLNANSQRNYPLAENASGADVTGSFLLPTDFALEIDLPIHFGLNVDPASFFLMQLSIYGGGFGLTVGYQPTVGTAIAVATAFVARGSHTPNNVYALGGVGDYADTVGKIVIGRLENIDQQPAGLFNFALAAARLEPDCVRPIIRGVSSISVASGTETSEKLYGDVELVAGENIQLVPVIVNGQNPQIRISAIKGEGLVEACVCVGDETSPPIRRINGIPPTPAGDFTLLGNACLQVQPITNGVKLNDVCSQPCCGCQELEVINKKLLEFGSQAAALTNFVNRLEASVTEMDQVVLGSKLSDRGCISCA